MADKQLSSKTNVSQFYRAWVNMKTRCTNKNIPEYHRYGGRGIAYCTEWKTFDGFIADMYDTFQEGLTLDRIDNSKGYSKENCRWVNRTIQARNTRNIDRAARHTYRGITQTVSEWAEEYGIKRTTLDARVRVYGWSIDKALTQKVG